MLRGCIIFSAYIDDISRFKSLDDIWYYGGQDEHQQEAVFNHHALHHGEVRKFFHILFSWLVLQIEVEVGDVLGVAGNHWDGFNKGRNHRTNRVGLYPEFKTREKLLIVEFPTYAKVKV